MNFLLYIFTTYFASSLILYLFINRVSGLRKTIDPLSLFLIVLGLGPLAVGCLLYVAFLLFPHRGDHFYLVLISAVFSVLFLISFREVRELGPLFLDIRRAISEFPRLAISEHLCLVMIIFALALVSGRAMLLQLNSWDGSVLMKTSQIFYEQKSISGYPFINSHSSGFYSNSSHVPVFHMLEVWSFIFLGNGLLSPLAQSVSSVYFVYCILGIFVLVQGRTGRQGAFIASALFSFAPIIIIYAQRSYMDTFRLYPVILAVYFLIECLRDPGKISLAALAGISLALTAVVHSSHLIMVPALMIAFLATMRHDLRTGIKVASVMALIIVIIGGAGYAYNYLHTGSLDALLQDHKSSSKMMEIQSKHLLRMRNQYYWWAVIRYGRLQEFFNFHHWGLLAYLGLAGLISWMKSDDKTSADRFILIFSGLFYLIVKDPLSLTNNRFGYGIWSSCRYMLPLLIFYVYFTSIMLGSSQMKKAGLKISVNTGKQRSYNFNLAPVSVILVLFLSAVFLGKSDIKIKDSIMLCFSPSLRKDENRDYFIEAIKKYVNGQSEVGSKFLTFNPLYFLYAERQGLFYLDPMLAGFYDAESTEEKMKALRGLGADHIISQKAFTSNGYYIYNILGKLIHGPGVEVVFENRVIEIYRLKRPDAGPRENKRVLNFNELAQKMNPDRENDEDKGFEDDDFNKWVFYSNSDRFYQALKLSVEDKGLLISKEKISGAGDRVVALWNASRGESEKFYLRSPALEMDKAKRYYLCLKVNYPEDEVRIIGGEPKVKIYLKEYRSNYSSSQSLLATLLLSEGPGEASLKYEPCGSCESIVLLFKFYNVREWVGVAPVEIYEIED